MKINKILNTQTLKLIIFLLIINMIEIAKADVNPIPGYKAVIASFEGKGYKGTKGILATGKTVILDANECGATLGANYFNIVIKSVSVKRSQPDSQPQEATVLINTPGKCKNNITMQANTSRTFRNVQSNDLFSQNITISVLPGASSKVAFVATCQCDPNADLCGPPEESFALQLIDHLVGP